MDKLTNYDLKKADEELGVCLDLEKLVEWISENLEPEQVYPKSFLEDWAENNGYTKE